MKGKRSAKPFYTQLSSVHCFHYQCSEMSSAKEIEGVYKSAIDRQNRLIKAGMLDEICCVFLDEAGNKHKSSMLSSYIDFNFFFIGLPDEMKHAMKVIHYYMDHPIVSSVIS
jgi:hypothetical protein